MMWFFILGGMLVAAIIGLVFVIKKISEFTFIAGRFSEKKAVAVSAGIVLAVIVALYLYGKAWNTMVIFIHLLLFWLIFELIFLIASKIFHKEKLRKFTGFSAIIFTIVYLCFGSFFAYHVYRTEYIVPVETKIGVDSLRIVGFSDSHVGTTFKGTKLIRYVEEINKENPDLIVIAGDFVDDDTSLQDMLDACNALSALKSKYGTYFIFGNHDPGYYNSRGYSKEVLVNNLKAAGVTVLADEVVSIAGNVYLCGRDDAGNADRKSMSQLTADLSPDCCLIVLDHQPNDYASEAEYHSDLVISGHTHGGQFFPINKAGEWFGMNDMTYGYLKDGRTNYIVSSGISDWAFKLKTGCISEYFVIDLTAD